MKRHSIFMTVCLLFALVAVPMGLRAQDGDEGVFDSDLFDRIQSDVISFDTDNNAEFTGNVKLDGEMFNLECSQLIVRASNDQISAKGKPVKITQDEMWAECRNFEYNIATGRSVLTGNPVIYQRKNGRIAKVSGDIITITQDKDGESSVNVNMEKGSNRTPTLEWIDDPKEKEKSKKTSKKSSKKVTSPELIKLPMGDI